MAKEGQLAMRAATAGIVVGGGGEGERHEIIPEVLLDPSGNTPLMVFDVMVNELPQLETGWQPPMRLTTREKEIVDHEGLVTILGRSGTGKTLCMAMRMLKDLERASTVHIDDFRQIFVARSDRLCRQVRRLVEQGGHKYNTTGRREAAADDGAAAAVNSTELDGAINRHFVPTVEYFKLVEDSIDFPKLTHIEHRTWGVASRVHTHEFKNHFWKQLPSNMQRGFGSKKTTREEQRTLKTAVTRV